MFYCTCFVLPKYVRTKDFNRQTSLTHLRYPSTRASRKYLEASAFRDRGSGIQFLCPSTFVVNSNPNKTLLLLTGRPNCCSACHANRPYLRRRRHSSTLNSKTSPSSSFSTCHSRLCCTRMRTHMRTSRGRRLQYLTS